MQIVWKSFRVIFEGRNLDLQAYLESLHLSRDILDVMIGGRSAIDSRGGIPAPTLDDAEKFINYYGYDLSEPIESAELLGNYHESIRFIKKYFLKPENADGADLEIPKLFFELQDLRKLFLFANDKNLEQAEKRHWACAILRVMHTISHMDKDIRTDYFSAIQQQIFDRFYKKVYNVDNKLFLGDPKNGHEVPLVYFQTKPRKARDSMILKLLHKPENVAEELFDQVGVRFVTKNSIDALRVVKYLRDQYLVIPANLKPSRARNSLIDAFVYRRIWREARSQVNKEMLRSPGEINAFIEKEIHMRAQVNQKDNANPFTSSRYTALQFTGRQLIKFKNPVYEDLRNLKNTLKEMDLPEVKKLSDRVELAKLAKVQRFFYPFEVQIMDLPGYEQAQSGEASHVTYKANQVQAAMQRVLGRSS